MPKKKSKIVKNIFFCLKQISKCDTCFYTLFSRAFQKYSHKKVMGYFRFFFTHSRLFTALYPTLCVKKKITKFFFQITIYEKSKNFAVIVSQMRVLGKKSRVGGAPKAPPHGLYRVLTPVPMLRFFVVFSESS